MKSPYRLAKDLWQLLPVRTADRLRQMPVIGRAVRAMSAGLIDGAAHDEIYDARYYEFVDRLAAEAAPIMVDSLVQEFAPATAVDVGCGTGAFLAELQRRGPQVHGLEYSDAGIARTRAKGVGVSPFDLRTGARPTLPRERFDLVTSFEVAEHLPPELADRFVDTLASLGDRIVMTAAVPGQGGMNHVNEQPNEYWIAKLRQRGFTYATDVTQRFRREWQARLREQHWYADNVMVFQRAG
jgi:SAM-dependent methyltransferase